VRGEGVRGEGVRGEGVRAKPPKFPTKLSNVRQHPPPHLKSKRLDSSTVPCYISVYSTGEYDRSRVRRWHTRRKYERLLNRVSKSCQNSWKLGKRVKLTFFSNIGNMSPRITKTLDCVGYQKLVF
jgi:hypothetical protein